MRWLLLAILDAFISALGTLFVTGYAPAWIDLMINLGLSCPIGDNACLRQQSIGVFVILFLLIAAVIGITYFVLLIARRKRLKKFTATLRSRPGKGQPKIACIKIDNESGSDVTDLRVELKHLEYLRDDGYGTMAFDTSCIVLNKRVDRVAENSSIPIDIAEDIDHRIKFLFDDESSPRSLSKINREVQLGKITTFEIAVEVGGKFWGRAIQPPIKIKGCITLMKLDMTNESERELGLENIISWIEIS
jgi:hypothetical protein